MVYIFFIFFKGLQVVASHDRNSDEDLFKHLRTWAGQQWRCRNAMRERRSFAVWASSVSLRHSRWAFKAWSKRSGIPRWCFPPVSEPPRANPVIEAVTVAHLMAIVARKPSPPPLGLPRIPGFHDFLRWIADSRRNTKSGTWPIRPRVTIRGRYLKTPREEGVGWCYLSPKDTRASLAILSDLGRVETTKQLNVLAILPRRKTHWLLFFSFEDMRHAGNR